MTYHNCDLQCFAHCLLAMSQGIFLDTASTLGDSLRRGAPIANAPAARGASPRLGKDCEDCNIKSEFNGFYLLKPGKE